MPDEEQAEPTRQEAINVMDTLRYFGEWKHLRLLLAVFFFILVGYMDFFMLLFLMDKFMTFSIYQANCVTFGSSMAGCLIFTLWLYKAPRRVLNFLTSGAILLVTVILLVSSLTMDKLAADRVGFVSLCKQ